MASDNAKKDIQNRLKRIEGQVKGIEKMIDNDASCKEILIQIAAVRSAINKAGAMVLQNYAKNCLGNCEALSNDERAVDDLVSTLTMFMK
ncbi:MULTISPECIES: metal-sensitive transcriptional regulator [unclassified Clostridium]|uniref:metal-sensitive transcriptional regulator n=1 Tax=unclassified Clostridium TaxID=2614128 RepID=UPI00052CCE6E|nr:MULTISPECIES: metal-sensitive transcriptional regulator [unclassified Clostridium]KGK87500.1 hypothetical protein DP68_09365 [Clostridium sp. HMP27]